jgi:hypothetical protein
MLRIGQGRAGTSGFSLHVSCIAALPELPFEKKRPINLSAMYSMTKGLI